MQQNYYIMPDYDKLLLHRVVDQKVEQICFLTEIEQSPDSFEND